MRQFDKRLLRFLGQHCLAGMAGGAVFGAALLYFNIMGFRDLVWDSPDRGLALFLLFFGLFITFGSLGMGWGVMSSAQDDAP